MAWHFYTPAVVPTIGTALPSNPVDGQEFTLVDSLSAPTYSWRLRYVAAKASNKWVFVGGSPATVSVTATESTTSSASYADLSTTGPSFTVPVAGDYVVEISCLTDSNTVASNQMSFAIGGTGASDDDRAQTTLNSTYSGTMYRKVVKTALAAATALVCKYKVSGGTGDFLFRVIEVTPIAIGG